MRLSFRLPFPRLLAPALAAGAFLLCFLPSARAEVEIVRLWTGYKETSAFLRLREFITGRESFGDTIILRTQPEDRTGLYYTVRLSDKERKAIPSGKVHLQVIPPEDVDPVEYTFEFEGRDDRQLRFEIGVTGEDWPYGRTLPLAWKLEFLDTDGNVLASRHSFLWSDNAPEVAAQ